MGDFSPGADGFKERLVARSAFHKLPCKERLGGEQRAFQGEGITGRNPLSRLVGHCFEWTLLVLTLF